MRREGDCLLNVLMGDSIQKGCVWGRTANCTFCNPDVCKHAQRSNPAACFLLPCSLCPVRQDILPKTVGSFARNSRLFRATFLGFTSQNLVAFCFVSLVCQSGLNWWFYFPTEKDRMSLEAPPGSCFPNHLDEKDRMKRQSV